jgi:DHA2 family multidrug resistance protein-like MFS transporter
MPAAITDTLDGLPVPQRYRAILTIALGLIMAVMDGAIANVALPLPTIAEDLRASPAFSIWIVNGYQLAITISLLPLASLGEIIGYRRVYLPGLLLFTLASLFCALSHTLVLLTIARVVQGFGAAGIMSVNMALVRFTYPHRILGRGIGFNALVVAVSAAVGPTLAAGILATATWPYLFAVNLPFGIAAVLIGMRALPHTPRSRHAFDWQSALMSAIMFGLGIAAIDSGEAPLLYLSEALIAAIACMLLVRRQFTAASPLLPVDLMRIPIFTLSICTSVASFCAQMLAFVALPFYLSDRFGYSCKRAVLVVDCWRCVCWQWPEAQFRKEWRRTKLRKYEISDGPAL